MKKRYDSYPKASKAVRPRDRIDPDEVVRMREEGTTMIDIADHYGVSESTLRKRMRETQQGPPRMGLGVVRGRDGRFAPNPEALALQKAFEETGLWTTDPDDLILAEQSHMARAFLSLEPEQQVAAREGLQTVVAMVIAVFADQFRKTMAERNNPPPTEEETAHTLPPAEVGDQ